MALGLKSPLQGMLQDCFDSTKRCLEQNQPKDTQVVMLSLVSRIPLELNSAPCHFSWRLAVASSGSLGTMTGGVLGYRTPNLELWLRIEYCYQKKELNQRPFLVAGGMLTVEEGGVGLEPAPRQPTDSKEKMKWQWEQSPCCGAMSAPLS